jgi:hypothetical protein
MQQPMPACLCYSAYHSIGCREKMHMYLSNSTIQDLLQCFQEFGPVKNCTVAMHNGKPKGFGFIKL